MGKEKDSGPPMHASGIFSAETLASKTRLAKLGDSEAAYAIHQHWMFSHDPAASLKWLRIAAIQGNAKAQHAMFVYLTIPGEKTTLEDRIEAGLWLQKAGAAGFELAVEALKRGEIKP